jgi:hypothetical protein
LKLKNIHVGFRGGEKTYSNLVKKTGHRPVKENTQLILAEKY